MSEKENVKNLLTNSKSRLNIILVFGILLVLVLVGVFFLKRHSATPTDLAPAVGGVNSVSAATTPGTSESSRFNKNLAEANTKDAALADKNNSTYLPTLVNNNVKDVDTEPPPVKALTTPDRAGPIQIVDTHPTAPINTVPTQEIVKERKVDPSLLRKQQEAAIAAQEAFARKQELEIEVQNRKKDYVKQLSLYVGEWTPNQQFMENTYKNIALTKDVAPVAPATGTAQSAADAAAAQKQVIAVAGSFIPSVLISGVNTDYQGPVVAKIVSGTLKDAVVTGNIVTGPDGALLKFNKIAFSDGTSAKINGYAVSSDAYSYKMATDVDHHYLSNYSTLFAGAFLQGYGQAEQSSGQTTTVDPTTGAVTESTSALSTSQIGQKAGGNVAETVGSSLIAKSQRPPTITIDVGTPFSILLVDNLAI